MRKKVEKGLIPLLVHVFGHKMKVDLQDIFKGFIFYIICSLLQDHDPESLSLDLPFIPCEKVITNIKEALLYRHIMPSLKVGYE